MNRNIKNIVYEMLIDWFKIKEYEKFFKLFKIKSVGKVGIKFIFGFVGFCWFGFFEFIFCELIWGRRIKFYGLFSRGIYRLFRYKILIFLEYKGKKEYY